MENKKTNKIPDARIKTKDGFIFIDVTLTKEIEDKMEKIIMGKNPICN